MAVIEFEGRRMTSEEWAKELGITSRALRYRLENWSLSKALSSPRCDKGYRRKYHAKKGQRFGMMEVLGEYSVRDGVRTTRMLTVRCDCGEVVNRDLIKVVSGHIKSCGCHQGRRHAK